nr:ribose-phosphate pyrophosphokinase-like domain-containing protein [Micromonospora sp. DSM 115978]
MRDVTVFSGSAHPQLAAEICERLGVPLHPVRVQRFANDCLGVQLQANCRERDVFLIQPLVQPVQDHLVELLLMLDAARGASAARTTVVMPHYAYARCLGALPRGLDDALGDFGTSCFDRRRHQFFARLEVGVDRRPRDPRDRRDRADGGAFQATTADAGHGGVDNLFPRRFGADRRRPARPGRTPSPRWL